MFSSGKTPGTNGIPPEVFKCGGIVICSKLLELCKYCWEKGDLPQEFKDFFIITIYQQKGNRHDCGNHRGISFLSIARKLLAKVLLKRLLSVSELVLPESQCSFRANSSTIHMPLYVVFIGFTKAFNSDGKDGHWSLLS